MYELFKRTSLFFALIFAASAHAQTDTCLEADEVEFIAAQFKQFKPVLKDGQEEYCKDELGEKPFKLLQTLVLLKNAAPKPPTYDKDDALTYQAVDEKDWWAYFIKRTDLMEHDPKDPVCQGGVIAYVMPNNWLEKAQKGRVIHLCSFFFERSSYDRVSTMLHEVRHFDGHGHVTCTRGNEKGNRGACDQKIVDKGSYAISVQTLVSLSRSEQFPVSQKGLIEASATYMAFNKFNKIPKVKTEDTLLLSNRVGEVYKWIIGKGMELITTLDSPSSIAASGSNVTIYPLDRSKDAYRTDRSLKTKIEKIGLYAETYNKDEERSLYDSVSYFGTGGLLKNNTLITLCNGREGKLGFKSLDEHGLFTQIVTLTNGGAPLEQDSYLLSDSGDLVPYTCKSNDSDEVVFGKSLVAIDASLQGLRQSFGLSGKQFAISEEGELLELSLDKDNGILSSKSIEMPNENIDWVSAAPFAQPEIF